MQNFEIHKQHARLKSLISQSGTVCNSDAEALSHWAKYLCIVAAGFLENALKEVYSDFVVGAAPAPVANFAKSKLLQIKNPQSKTFLDTAALFRADWQTELSAFLQENGRKEAIDSIMAHRHQIAHGKGNNVNVTLAQMKDYIEKSVEVITYIESQCKR